MPARSAPLPRCFWICIPRARFSDQPYREGQNPFEIAQWFDSGNYSISRNWGYGNLWVQGGPRTRTFFAEEPKKSPALNKIPLVKWDQSYAYVSSTHMLLPRGLNLVFDEWGGEKASGCLLHAKFLDTFAAKAEEEMARGEHYANSHEYRAYQEGLKDQPDLWCKWSEKYINWRQLEILGPDVKGELGMTLGFVMLCHTALDRAAQVARNWASSDCPVVIHVDKRTPTRAGRKAARRSGRSGQCPLFHPPCLRMGHLGHRRRHARRRQPDAARFPAGAACLPCLWFLPAAAPGCRNCAPIWTNARAPISSKA